MSGAFIPYLNSRTRVPATQVTGNVIYNLDMKNYIAAATTWPDTGGNNYTFTFYTGAAGTTPTAPTVTNVGTDQAYFYTNLTIWAKGPTNIMNAAAGYTKGGVVRGTSGTGAPFNAGYFMCSAEARDTFWFNNGAVFPGGGAILSAGNHNSNGSTYFDVIQAAVGELANLWYYVSVSFSPTTGWFLYVNGTLVGASSRLAPGPAVTTPVIAATQSTPGFAGNIGAVTAYSRVLSATEHAQNAAYWMTRYNGTAPA